MMKNGKRQKIHFDSDDEDTPLLAIAGRQQDVHQPNMRTDPLESRFEAQKQALIEARKQIQEQAKEISDLHQQLAAQTEQMQDEIRKQGEAQYQQLSEEQRQAEVQQKHSADLAEMLQAVKNIAAVSTNTFGLVKSRVDRKHQMGGSTSNSENVAPPAPSHLPAPSAPSTSLEISDGKIVIPIRYENFNPGTVYEPVTDDAEEYGILRLRSGEKR
ncbi:uncharacterized protein LOC110985299 [Acanthaster planci]|uniref:Uncharacterized protein LOC110985299 n=1 Tax=Acanthaster planci TaxID=133434 RepID=A0A8B7ZFC5_ACAPL|nr:uncharacterized protein LOC110985299 [Acanthaster planci]